MTISAIAAMPLRDFFGYLVHSLRYMTPSKRQELYLAQISYLVAATMGGHKGGIEDFMLFKESDSPKQRKKAKKTKSRTRSSDPFKNFNPVNKKG